MKPAKAAGLCIIAMLVCMAMTATASAATGPVWEACVKGASGTKYAKGEHEQCEEASGSGEYGWAEITGTEKSVGHGSLLLIDETVTKVEVECNVESEGSFGPGKFSRFEKATYTCKPGKNCEKIIGKVEAKNTPWQEELVETTEKTLDDKTTNGKSGTESPEIVVKCDVLGVEGTDEIKVEEVPQAEKSARSGFLFLELLELIDPNNPRSLKGSLGWLRAVGGGVRALPLGG